MSDEKKEPTQPPSPDDRCDLCHHRRSLHREDGCHYLGAHGGPDHTCGGRAAEGSYRGMRCAGFIPVEVES